MTEQPSEGRGRRSARRWLLSLLVAVAVLAALAGAGELVLRTVIPSTIEGTVREQFGLTPDHPVEVELGGSALLHALTGRVGDVSLRVDEASVFDGIPVSVVAHADSVPFRARSGEIEGVTASVTLPRDQLGPVIGLLTKGAVDSGEVSDGLLKVGRTVPVFGVQVPLTVSLRLGVEGGAVVVEPVDVGVVGVNVTVEQIRAFAGSALDGILTTHTVCVADRLPAGVTLTSLRLSSTGAATVSAEFSPTILSDPAELQPGSC